MAKIKMAVRDISMWLLTGWFDFFLFVCLFALCCCRCIQRVTNWWALTAISGSWRRFCCLRTPSAPRDIWLPWRRWSALSRGGERLHLVRIDFYRLNTLTKSQQLNRFFFTNDSQPISKNAIEFHWNGCCNQWIVAKTEIRCCSWRGFWFKWCNHFMDVQRVAYQRISQRAVR